MKPRLSMVIPAYNPGDYLVETLESLERQTIDGLEVIVVDDGSTDGSIDRAGQWVDGRQKPHADIHIISQQNSGVSAARNTGVAAARADLIGFVDADDIWLPDKALRHAKLMEARPSLVLSYSSFSNIDEVGAAIGKPFLVPVGPATLSDLLVRNVIHTSTVVARKSAIERVGGFDVALRTYEDFDLWLRLAEIENGEVYAFSEIDTHYRRHSDQTTRDWVAMREGWERVAERIAERHPDLWGPKVATASAYQYEYCAWLAHAGSDFRSMRRLMLKAWRTSPRGMIRSEFALMGSAIATASLLPRPIQKAIGRAYVEIATRLDARH